jgi:hypothetical protein
MPKDLFDWPVYYVVAGGDTRCDRCKARGDAIGVDEE